MKSMWKALLFPIMLVALVLPRGVLSQDAPAFKNEEIEQLVAPIALYPDALVAQILMASTYPLEVVEAARWVKQNPKVTGKALEDAMQQQKWDPSVKSLTAFPQVLDMMNTKLDLTQKLGDAFLGQQKEVLDAVQRLRGKADQAGNLKSSKEQTVTKAQEGGQTVIKIEPANPEVVYVPTYNPAVVYGSWPYPSYPPYYYYPPGYVPGAALFSFGVGMAVGAALWGGCNWGGGGGGGVYINHNNYNNFNKTNISNNQNWQHNSEHRRGTEYRDKGSQDKFGKGGRQDAASREQFRGRADQGRQEIQRGGDQFQRDVSAADRSRGGDRAGGAGDRGGAGSGGFGDRGGAGDRGGGGFDRTGGGGGAFDGAGRGGGASTRDASSRGASSRASAGGGGGARAGGGGGGRAGGGGGGRGGRR